MKISSYSKIFNIGHPRIAELFDGEVVVEEKIDGSQISFGIINGELNIRSRGADMTHQAPKMFAKGVEQIEKCENSLLDGYIYRGEYLSKPKHNTLVYERTPTNYIIIFDIDRNGQTDYLSYKDKVYEARNLGFECVPMLYQGKIDNFDDFIKLLDEESILGGTTIEGMVIKNYNRWTVDGKTMMGKFVSEKFKEKHQKDRKGRNFISKDILTIIGETYRTEARWEKAIQHLKERGELTNEPKDIGPLIKEVHQDILEECKDEIAEKLFKWGWKQIYRRFTVGLPEYYKKKLAKGTFQDVRKG